MKNANDYLRYVSSIIYTNANVSYSDVYLQTNETDYKRNYGLRTLLETYDNGGHVNGIAYNLPTAEKLDSGTTRSKDNSVFIYQGTTNGLPSSLAGCDKATLHSVAESADFMINVTNNISERMGSNNFVSKIKSSVSSEIWDQAYEMATEPGGSFTSAIQALMPDSIYQGVKPLVEWAVTITPMMCWRASINRPDSFWAFNDEYGTMTIVMPSSTGKEAVLIMDAYYSATYNQVTTGNAGANSIWFSGSFQKAISKADGYIPADTIEQYWKDGILRRWYIVADTNTNILRDIGTCAYVDEPGPIIGVCDWINQTSYDDNSIARFGGIYVAIMEKGDTPSIPVYYYITPDPDDPRLPPGSATPPTFTPDPPPGTKVTKS